MTGDYLPPPGENERLHILDRFRNKLKEMVRDKVECSICTDLFETGKESAVLLKCGHIIHARCFCQLVATIPDRNPENWLVESEGCHYCKANLSFRYDLLIPRPAPRILTRQTSSSSLSVPTLSFSALKKSTSGLLDALPGEGSNEPADAYLLPGEGSGEPAHADLLPGEGSGEPVGTELAPGEAVEPAHTDAAYTPSDDDGDEPTDAVDDDAEDDESRDDVSDADDDATENDEPADDDGDEPTDADDDDAEDDESGDDVSGADDVDGATEDDEPADVVSTDAD